MDLVEPSGGVMGDLRQLHLLAGEPGDHPADDHHQPKGAGVDDACLGEHRELLGGVTNRLLAGEQRRREHLGEQRVLLLRARLGIEALAAATARVARRRRLPSPGSRSASSPRRALARRRRRRSAALVSAASISPGSISRPGGVATFSAAPRTIWLRITPELPRAPISAARATSRTISGRRGSPSALRSSLSSSSSTWRMVSAMLSPVSPSATGNTLRSLISLRRSSRWASATPTRWRKRTIDESGTAREPTARTPLRVLLDLVGLQAARADVDAAGSATVVDANLLQVRVEAPAGGDHRVAARVAERGTLATAEADLGHRTRDGSEAAIAEAEGRSGAPAPLSRLIP